MAYEAMFATPCNTQISLKTMTQLVAIPTPSSEPREFLSLLNYHFLHLFPGLLKFLSLKL
jgi:hypothetical protein